MDVSYLQMGAAEKRAQEIANFSEQPANWYWPGKTTIPGDLKEHVMRNGILRIVFCWAVTIDDDDKFEVRRHMSIFVMDKKSFPQPSIVWTLARYFGFTGAHVHEASGLVQSPAKKWAIAAEKDDGCIIVQEIVRDAPKPSDQVPQNS